MRNLFKDHPASVGESYFEHMGSAFGFAARLLGAAFACFVHGLFPFLFTSTGSRTVKQLHQEMVAGRHAHQCREAEAGQPGSSTRQVIERSPSRSMPGVSLSSPRDTSSAMS